MVRRCQDALKRWLFLSLCILVWTDLQAAVWTTPAILERAKGRAEKYPWAAAIVDSIVADAERWLSSPPLFPEVVTGYFHDYFCPEHAVQLRPDPDRPRVHLCPVDGREFRGEKYDAAWGYLVHYLASQRLPNLALAYVFSGKQDFAEAALDWLRQVRDRYPTLPLHGSHAGRGKLMGQSLDEAVWAVHAVRAYEILRREGIVPEGEHRLFVQWLWRPMYQLLAGEPEFRGRIHNISCWHLAAMASIAVIMQDRALLRYALFQPLWGLQAQMLRGVDSDGMWYEGSLGYHFYALQALMAGAWVARLEGLSLGDAESSLEKMLRLPLHLADEKGNLPALNDGWPNQRIQSYLATYEWASAMFPRATLERLWSRYVAKRTSVEALLFGPDTLQSAVGAVGPILLRHSGLAALREGPLYVLFDFGPHGGGHGHYDKLQFLINGRGQWLSPDYGTAGYGIPAYRGWFKRTASHNTVSVDAQNQRASSGELVAWGSGTRWQIVRARCRNAYPGVDWDRCVILVGNQVVVVDWLRAREERVYDWHFRAAGAFEISIPGSFFVPTRLSGDGYKYYEGVRATTFSGDFLATWRSSAGWIRLHWAGQDADTLFTGVEPGIPMHRKYPFVIIRRVADSTVFAANFVVSDVEPSSPESIAVRRDGGQVTVDLRDERIRLHLALPGMDLVLNGKRFDGDTALEDADGLHVIRQ